MSVPPPHYLADPPRVVAEVRYESVTLKYTIPTQMETKETKETRKETKCQVLPPLPGSAWHLGRWASGPGKQLNGTCDNPLEAASFVDGSGHADPPAGMLVD